MRRLLLVAVAACVVFLAFTYARRWNAGRPTPRAPVSGAAAVVERFQCYRCHDAPGKLVPAERKKHCIRCHQDILAGALDAEYPHDALIRWKHDIVQLTLVPSLAGIERHLDREWLVEFLQRPGKIRPGLLACMPRLAIGPEDARAITDYFIPETAPVASVALGDRERGRDLFRVNACASCHAFSGAGLPDAPRTESAAARLAPDLRHARQRMRASAVLVWLEDPSSVKPDTPMPRFNLSPEQRRDLAAFVLETPLAAPPAPPAPERLPILARPIEFGEVQQRVFKKVCWHCHSDPAPVGGDGGPGNTGGFGYPGLGIDLSSYASMARGGRDARGERIDLFAKSASGVPLLVRAMLARHVELGGGEVPGLLGMPLGLQPMRLEEIQLVETWLAQGARGPSE